MVLVSKPMGQLLNADYRFSFSPQRDAFDLIDLSHSPYVSIVRTFDGSCFDQLLSRTPSGRNMRERAGGWVLFPREPRPDLWPTKQSLRLTTWRIQRSPAPSQCASNHAAGLTNWFKPQVYTFESGKKLKAIRSDHFAAADLSKALNSFERTYFTEAYGLTRWESWWTSAHCQQQLGANHDRCSVGQKNPLLPRCATLKTPGATAPGVEVHGGQRWIRMDCRDMTRTLLVTRPYLPIAPSIATQNGIVDLAYGVDARR